MTDSSEKISKDSVTELVSIERVQENNSNINNTSSSNTVEQDTSIVKNKDILVNRTYSWHEHVYRKLTNKPTPHYIENILGLQNKTNSCDNSADTTNKRMTICSPNHPDLKTVNTPQDSNEPLNLSVRSETKVRLKATTKG